jgi:hypothetical protein
MSVPGTATGQTASATAEEILKGLSTASTAIRSAAGSSAAYASSYATQENGSYALNVLFYLVLYAFVLFLALILIHFTIYPVFKFTPGARGLIGVSTTKDSTVYWNTKKQPATLSYAPVNGDALSGYPFTNNFSFSVDLFVRRMTDTTATTRVILYKTYANGPQAGTSTTTSTTSTATFAADPLNNGPSAAEADIATNYMNSKVSMFMYLTKTNDLVVTFYSGANGTPYSSRQIKNIPLYTPFRVTVVVEDKTFSVYINGQQAFQRTVPGQTITLNTLGNLPTAQQRFFVPPAWADQPTKTIFLQNLQLWTRAISYTEVQTAQPALALEEDFGMAKESGTSSCGA